MAAADEVVVHRPLEVFLSLIDHGELASPIPLLRVVADSDAATIRRSLRDPAVFATIFDRHWARLFAYCVSRAGEAGEDLAAETFRVAFAKRRSFSRDSSDAAPWLYGIATNLIREHYRRAERGRRATARLGRRRSQESYDSIGRSEARQLGPALSRALGGMTAADRDALLLFAWGDLSYEEIARATGVPIGTVRSRISRARAHLQSELKTRSDYE